MQSNIAVIHSPCTLDVLSLIVSGYCQFCLCEFELHVFDFIFVVVVVVVCDVMCRVSKWCVASQTFMQLIIPTKCYPLIP